MVSTHAHSAYVPPRHNPTALRMRVMPTPQVFYTSGSIHSEIKRLFANPGPGERRVALVAYVGSDALKLLPHPKGVEVVCSPTPLATSHVAVQELQKRGAFVRFSDRLHMKVYWSSH